eukprot:SAG11_NODE_1955_length_4005_cov_2.390937_7_plen_160_part_00
MGGSETRGKELLLKIFRHIEREQLRVVEIFFLGPPENQNRTAILRRTGALVELWPDRSSGRAVPRISSLLPPLLRPKLKPLIFAPSSNPAVDTDGSGELDLYEFEDALQRMGIELPIADMKLAFESLDEDGSGDIAVRPPAVPWSLFATPAQLPPRPVG